MYMQRLLHMHCSQLAILSAVPDPNCMYIILVIINCVVIASFYSYSVH